MNKLLQNVNLAGASLFLQILGVSGKQAALHCTLCNVVCLGGVSSSCCSRGNMPQEWYGHHQSVVQQRQQAKTGSQMSGYRIQRQDI